MVGIKGKWLQQKFLLLMLITSVVPMLTMWQVLIVDQKVHLANPGETPTSSYVTDLDGAARLTYLLSGMTFPWSDSIHISAPTGASIWRLETVTQSVQVILLWLFSRIADPMLSTNVLVFLGWTLTGIATYVLATDLGARKATALVAALVVQLLPSMRFMAANFTSYVYVAVPVAVIIYTRRYCLKPRGREFLSLGVVLLGAALFDPYWFYFSVVAVAIISLTQLLTDYSIRESRRFQRRLAFLSFLAVIVFTAARILVGLVGQRGNSRQIAVSSHVDVRNGTHSFETWLSSEYVGVGWPLLLLSGIALVVVVLFYRNDLMSVGIAGFAFWLLSTRLTILGQEYVSATFLRHLMPGVRFFDRSGLIASALFIVLTAVVLDRIVSTNGKTRSTTYGLLVVGSLLPLSFPGSMQVGVTQSYHDWQKIRDELATASNPRLVALPFTRRGRDWIEQASFRAPLVNDYVFSRNDPEIMLQASHGPAALAAYLVELGTTHLLAVDSETDKILRYGFGEPNFVLRETINLNGFGEGEDFVARLYRIRVRPNDRTCRGCGLGELLVPQVAVKGELVYPPDVGDQDTKWWWVGPGSTDVTLQFVKLPDAANAQTTWNLRLDLAPCASQVLLTIVTRDQAESITLTSSRPTIERRIELAGNASGAVQLNAVGESCVPQGDNRQMLYRIQAFIDG